MLELEPLSSIYSGVVVTLPVGIALSLPKTAVVADIISPVNLVVVEN
ncbi:MAG: hypothetical protein AAFW70_20035 [Cyanobacteria bacterium J06635_10]